MTSASAGRAQRSLRRGMPRWPDATPWLLLLPIAVSIGAVSIYPILNGIWLSFRNTSLVSQQDDFVGLLNYGLLLGDEGFWNAWRHTVVFTLVSTALETLIGLGMALLLFERFPGRGLVRAAVLVPWAMPTVVTSKMFGWLFDGQHGVVNWLLRSVGLIGANINWYGSVDHALGTIIVADVWKTAPFMALLLLAGLQTIPDSLLEAARMDGAKPWQAFIFVRLPMLWSTLLIAGLFRALDAFRVFDLVYVLTGGGPADSTETLSTLSYKTLFSTLQFGYGSTLSTAMFITEALIAAGFAMFIVRKIGQAR
ncbi:sugar ABC transporter permease [Lichenibacterium ramalinae]|uniref:Sugar ABC transporter permease n=2 Tax=Lichenibacterium ramalinae TaxID=2316527 RepID=A0A4Q2R425_9HYPH|nr:sugar ABC transporter permease [Lichenibacterium ramalinae]